MFLYTMKTLFACLLPFLMLACQKHKNTAATEHFQLVGKTNSMPDGMMLYLTDILSNQIVDSAFVNRNKFAMEGKLADPPANYYLHNSDFSEFVSLWIEPGDLTFDASSTDFNKAILTGSKTHEEAKDFFQAIASIVEEDDTEETERLAIQFIKDFPGNRLSASMLAGYMPNLGPLKTKELYEPFSQANKESVYGVRIRQYIELNKDHQIGDPFTDFEMEDVDGKVIKLSDHLGKVTLLEFWASWCGPCREKNPELRRTYQKYNKQGFEIIGISLDFAKEDWTKAIAADSLGWMHVSDLKGRNSLAGIIYGANAIPDNFLIGQDGKILGKYLWGEELERAIEYGLK